MGDKTRVLFTSEIPVKHYDLFGYHTPRGQTLRMTNPRIISAGLRFLKQNLPQIEILEFPSEEEYETVLGQGWDVVGFSFFSDATDTVLRMVDSARRQGIAELWAGNYGALNSIVRAAVDRVFLGYAEDQVAARFGFDIGELVHPPIIDGLGIEPLGGSLLKFGWLYTARGCPLKCTFCQTPLFAPTLVETPLDSIDRVLRYYVENGVQMILILDEIFGLSRAHSAEVTKLLKKHDLPWILMTRSDILGTNLEEWQESGLVGAIVGIESLNPATLEDIHKKLRVETSYEIMERLQRRNLLTFPTYMIGFERDTVESIKRDLNELRKLNPDFVKLFFITPFPETPLWDEIESRYGIDTSDWSKFDGKHLVWNHPNLTREDAQELLQYGYSLFNTEDCVRRFVSKMGHQILRRRGPGATHSFFLSSLHNRLRGGWAGASSFFD